MQITSLPHKSKKNKENNNIGFTFPNKNEEMNYNNW